MKLARQYTHFELQRSLVSKFLQKYVSVVTPKHHWKAFVDLWWMGKKTFLESYNTVTFFELWSYYKNFRATNRRIANPSFSKLTESE